MMNKRILVLMLAIASASMLAMESDQETNYESEEIDETDDLARNLIWYIHKGHSDKALKLIQAGANVNYIEPESPFYYNAVYSRSALMRAAENLTLDENTQLILVQELMDNGADVNVTNSEGKQNALMLSDSERVDQLLIQAGTNIYQTNCAGDTALTKCAIYGFKNSITNILALATRLTAAELDSVKNWLLVDQRLRQGLHKQGEVIEPHRRYALPKDLKKLIAQNIYKSLAYDLQERVIKAGAQLARERVLNHFRLGNREEIVSLLDAHLDLNFLEGLVRAQVAESFRMTPRTLEILNLSLNQLGTNG